MLRSICGITLLLLALNGSAAETAAETVAEAIRGGSASLSSRLRVENVDDATKPEVATALTNRLVLGYKTAELAGFTALLEMEDITALDGEEEYNTSGAFSGGYGNGQTQYAAIVDPELTAINQLYVSGYGLKLGRQKVIVGNARFIGDVGWRQNDQVFTGISYENKTLLPLTSVQLAYLSKATDIVGETREFKLPLLSAKISPMTGFDLLPFLYAVDEVEVPANSWLHRGLRASLDRGAFLADASFAEQRDHADGSSAAADYQDLQLGWRWPLLTVKVQQETLQAGFKTPLATLHAYNGWADRFLATPAAGLVDRNVKLSGAVAGWNWLLAAHQFAADDGGPDYGRELDFSVGRRFAGNIGVLLKFADYRGDSEAPTAVLGSDTRKIWLQLDWQM